jgi:hypothetical protein
MFGEVAVDTQKHAATQPNTGATPTEAVLGLKRR